MLHVSPAGTRAGWSTVDAPEVPASVALLALESPGDSEAKVESSGPSVDVESSGDSGATVDLDGSPVGSPAESPVESPGSALSPESPGDSGARVDSDGVASGLADESDDPVLAEPPPGPTPDPPPPLGVGVVGDGLDEPPPLEGAVGDAEADAVGDELGVGELVVVGVGVGVASAITGGVTPGGTLVPAVRSCCQDQPTEPPSGTVRDPTPYDE